MAQKKPKLYVSWNEQLRALASSQQMLAAVPLVTLLGYWVAGEPGLVLAAVAVPATIVFGRRMEPAEDAEDRTPIDGLTGLPLRQELELALEKMLKQRKHSGLSTACLVVEVDDFKDMTDRHGHSASDTIIKAVATRLEDTMRGADLIARLDGATFAILLSPVRNADLESVIQISSRI